MPTEEQYIKMVNNKTSVLPRVCMRMISIILDLPFEKQQAIIDYIEKLGIAFQIQDDIIAVTSELYSAERGTIGEDIHEGKRTLMVVNACASDPKKGARLEEILNMKTEDEKLIKEAIGIL